MGFKSILVFLLIPPIIKENSDMEKSDNLVDNDNFNIQKNPNPHQKE
jgi:hypothetical protein